jgi:hypothetical protein
MSALNVDATDSVWNLSTMGRSVSSTETTHDMSLLTKPRQNYLVSPVTPEFLALFILNSRTLTGRCGMKRDQLRESANDQPASQVDYEVANDSLDETDWHARA